MKKLGILLITLFTLWSLGASPSAHGWEFKLIDDVIFGAPGQTIGWGYEITNDTPYFLEVSGLNPDAIDASLAKDPNVIIGFPILIPGETLQVFYSYNPSGSQGLFEFTWLPTVTELDSMMLSFYLDVNFYSTDPLSGSIPEYSEAALVWGYAGVIVPEPDSLWLLLTGLICGFILSIRTSNYLKL
jgi:hypothetical protein